jgi:hypothetical protein
VGNESFAIEYKYEQNISVQLFSALTLFVTYVPVMRMRFEVYLAVKLWFVVFWVVMLCIFTTHKTATHKI